MPVRTENIRFISAFVRNLDKLTRNSEEYAQIMRENLYSTVINRVESSVFISGKFKDMPYSENPLKAFKLGRASVTGQGMNKQLTINGITIDYEDWYWGEWDRKQKGIPKPFGGREIFGDRTPSGKPVPVFSGGYRLWRSKYNGLGTSVDLDFTGSMLSGFDVELEQQRGANQFGGKWGFNFEAPTGNYREYYTDYYRGWLQVTEQEVRNAFGEVSDKIVNTLLSRR